MWTLCRLEVLVRFTRRDGIHYCTIIDRWYSHGHLSYLIVKDCYREDTGESWGAPYYTMVEPGHIIEDNDDI